MPLTQIARERWKDFFDRASKAAAEQPTTVEVTGLSLGDRIAADRAALRGVSYEPREDTLTLFLEGLEHRIRQPRTIHVDEEGTRLNSFQAIDGDGVHHIVQLERVPVLARRR